MKILRFKDFVRKIYARKPFCFLLSKLTNGRAVDAFIYKIVPSHKLFKDNSLRRVKRNNILFDLDISQIVDWYIYFGVKEPSRIKLYELMKSGMVIYDVGGNIGDVTMNAAKIVGSDGAVISFEPHPSTYLRLYNHILVNNFSNVIAFNIGIGSDNGVFEMLEVKNNAGANRIVPINNSIKGNLFVSVVSLDKIWVSENLILPDIIKIDVEGYEMEVLKGATEIIKTKRPILFIEIADSLLKLQGQSAINVVKFISDLNYCVVSASNNNVVMINDQLEGCHFDIIAYPN